MIIKLASQPSPTHQALLHRETGVQHGDWIGADVEKRLQAESHGLKDRIKRAKIADKWTPRPIS